VGGWGWSSLHWRADAVSGAASAAAADGLYHVDRLRKLAHIIDLIGWTEPLERPAANHTCHITCRAPTCDELGHAVKG